MFMRTNSQFLGASVNEFIQMWAIGGDATLNLSTSGGLTTVAFNCTIGHPGAPHHLPPSAPFSSATTPPHRPRHRGAAEKEKNRQRAAAHQAAQAKATAPVPSAVPVTIAVVAATSTDSVKAAPSTGPVTDPSSAIDSMTSASSTASVVSKESESSSSLEFKCDQCNFTSHSDKGLKMHTRMKHRISQLDGHEEESEFYTNPCPLCHPAEVCHCGDCEECNELISELGFNTHIMNFHDPSEVKEHYGVDWIHKHKHLITRTESVQDRYHLHKWNTLMVL